MRQLIVLGFVGLLAQLIDGSLGMAYGVTSTTLLLATGIAPATASAAVHFSEIGTSLVSGISHHRFGNVDWKVVRRIGIPGAIGAFAGATVLSNLSTEVAKTVSQGIIREGQDGIHISPVMIFAGLVGAVLWNLATWYFGLPSSSTHALFGGLMIGGIAWIQYQAIRKTNSPSITMCC